MARSKKEVTESVTSNLEKLINEVAGKENLEILRQGFTKGNAEWAKLLDKGCSVGFSIIRDGIKCTIIVGPSEKDDE